MLRSKITKLMLARLFYNFYYRYIKQNGTRVLIYHAFGSNLTHDSYGISISLQMFEEHVCHIKKNYGLGWLGKGGDKCKTDRIKVLITIDDGYEDTMRAAEILVKHQVPFLLFITTGLIGKKQYLNKTQIRELNDLELCCLGTHGVEHIKLTTLTAEQQKYQIEKSKNDLEDIIQQSVDMMSLPHGQYNQETLSLIEKSRYQYNYSSRIGFNDEDNLNPYLIKRFEIIASDRICDLDYKILGYYDYLALIHNR